MTLILLPIVTVKYLGKGNWITGLACRRHRFNAQHSIWFLEHAQEWFMSTGWCGHPQTEYCRWNQWTWHAEALGLIPAPHDHCLTDCSPVTHNSAGWTELQFQAKFWTSRYTQSGQLLLSDTALPPLYTASEPHLSFKKDINIKKEMKHI